MLLLLNQLPFISPYLRSGSFFRFLNYPRPERQLTAAGSGRHRMRSPVCCATGALCLFPEVRISEFAQLLEGSCIPTLKNIATIHDKLLETKIKIIMAESS